MSQLPDNLPPGLPGGLVDAAERPYAPYVPTPPAACKPCAPSDCQNPFARLVVSYLLRGGTRVYWALRDTFLEARPYTFQLQVGQTDSNAADDWRDVGAPVTDQFFAIDGEQRVFGMQRTQYYRVQLTTAAGVYHSDPTGLLGTLSPRDWRLARYHMRAELVRMRFQAGQLGYLLKRRVTGVRCPRCLDPQTNDVKDPYCTVCWGTGFLCGYFFPVSCMWADIDPKAYHTTGHGQRGTISDVVVKARMCNVWMANEEDIWVNRVTDDRYYVHSVQNIAEYRGVPVTATMELRLAAATDPCYDIVIPQQLENWDLSAKE